VINKAGEAKAGVGQTRKGKYNKIILKKFQK
jgi:hypothetical protein